MWTVWYSNAGGWRHSPTLNGFFYVPLVLSCVVPYLTHRIWEHSEFSMHRRKIYSSHKSAKKNSCFSPTGLPKKTCKEYTLSSSERGKGYQASTSPRTQDPHSHFSPTWTSPYQHGENNNIHSSPSMAGVSHHKGLTPKLAWESRTRISQHREYRGIPTNNCFSQIRSDSIRAVYTLSHTQQWGTIPTGRIILWCVHQDVRNICWLGRTFAKSYMRP